MSTTPVFANIPYFGSLAEDGQNAGNLISFSDELLVNLAYNLQEVQWAQAKHKFGVDDLVMITKLTEAEVIAQLQKRYQNDFIYVSHTFTTCAPFPC
jgi:S-methylmethionine-dependent homocysteine/selenocysteine methylase